MKKNNIKIFLTLLLLTLNFSFISGQEIDTDEFLNRLDRVERNIIDLQKGIISNIDKTITSGYISRNESRFDNLETVNQENYGKLEEIENKITKLKSKIDIIIQDLELRILDFEEKIKIISTKQGIIQPTGQTSSEKVTEDYTDKANQENVTINENSISAEEVKVKYEDAIKNLWSSEYDKALAQLEYLKKIQPNDLMPNIQYWLGEVHYAQKNFNQAIIEFGEGLKKYPDSIKGPDNMLKLALSFSNIKKKIESCNILIELSIKYPDASKDVIQRSIKERKNLECPDE